MKILVSLPGAATEKEDPALFEVLSRNVGSREQSPVKDKDTTSQILEIESHLIESLSEADNVRHSTSRSGVDIDELPPAEDELEKNSQVESETSLKSVIEVEPAAPRVLQSVEVQLEPHSIAVATIIHDNELSEKQGSLESPALVNQLTKANKHLETNEEKEVDENFNSKEEVIEEEFVENKEEVKHIEEQVPVEEITKDIEVNTIEEQVLEDKKGEGSLKKEKEEVKGKEVENESVTQETTKEQSFENNKEVKQEHLSIDINGLPLPSTPLEEEEKKKFLDSIPHLEKNTDSILVSKQAKKEYYQSLRKYLIHEEENKPPVPLQTYRWEDLRRAKERVSSKLFFCTLYIFD